MGQLLVVRHGQASFGADDYDVLSPTGEEQARVLGAALADLAPDLVVHGSLVRQRRTAELLAAAAGWDVRLREDPRWNELEDLAQFAAVSGSPDGLDRDGFQQWYDAAMARWTGGEHDHDYSEPFVGFRDRANAALADVADEGTVVAVSSGGPIAAIASVLLAGDATTYGRLLPGIVNAGITRVISGRRGLTLLSFNEHQHLPPELRTYR
ncbi:histidine phosphatase family protein [Nocardioides sp. GXQ0305]|uniref:histidine phosphatase family protein n=1 Tax=Nocardioides sp. GXQ0305 TaxID=3423912 RepID=UPI003D7F1614